MNMSAKGNSGLRLWCEYQSKEIPDLCSNVNRVSLFMQLESQLEAILGGAGVGGFVN